MLTLFAQAQGNPFDRPEIVWGTAGLVAALLIGGAIVLATDRWRKKSATAASDADELTEYRALFDRGEITEAEYARLRQQVATRVKQSVGVPAPNAEGDAPRLVDGLPRVKPRDPPPGQSWAEPGPPPPPAPPQLEGKPSGQARRESEPPA